jgi:hypothetical protein
MINAMKQLHARTQHHSLKIGGVQTNTLGNDEVDKLAKHGAQEPCLVVVTPFHYVGRYAPPFFYIHPTRRFSLQSKTLQRK